MPGLLGAFAARFPDIGVRLHEDHTEALLASLRAGRFDLALTYDLNLGPDLAFEPLAEVPFHVVLPARHRLARRPAVSLRELIDEPVVLLGLPQSRDYFLSIFYGLGLQPRVAHETPSFEMVRGLVANGHGYSVMHSRPVSEQALDGMRLVYRPVSEKIRPTQLGLIRRKDARPRRMATAFASSPIPDGDEDVAGLRRGTGLRVNCPCGPGPGLRRWVASFSNVASSPKRAAKCTPTGKPSFDQCSGSEAAGWPVMLKMEVNGE
jgi:hypothetical protein